MFIRLGNVAEVAVSQSRWLANRKADPFLGEDRNEVAHEEVRVLGADLAQTGPFRSLLKRRQSDGVTFTHPPHAAASSPCAGT